MFCRDLMQPVILKCRPGDSAQTCALVMELERTDQVPIVDDDECFLGVVTDRDLALRVVGENLSPRTPVGEIMGSDPPLVCAPGDDLAELKSIWSTRRAQSAWVVDDAHRCVGTIRARDLHRSPEESNAQTFRR